MKRKLFAQNVSERKTHSRARDRDRATITRTVIQCFSGLFLYKGQPQLPPEKQIFSELKRGVWGGAENGDNDSILQWRGSERSCGP